MEIKGIKYIGPIFDSSGYAQACRGNILSLHSLGVPITLQPISFEKMRPDLGKDGKILGGLVNKGTDYNIVIIHTTPEFWHKYKEIGKTNVGYTIWETTKLHPDWKNYINDNVEKVLVGCEWNIEVFKNSGVTVPIGVVPHGINVDEFNNTEPYNIAGIYDEDYMFYSIFQWVERKHPVALIKAYWHAFQNNENVALVLKVYRGDYSDDEKNAIRETVKKIKEVTPMDNYPKLYLILDMLTQNEMLGLHARGDCYASLDRGEGFGLCVGKNTKISVPDGIRYAKDISVGDEVLSVDGEFHKVNNVSSKYVSNGLIVSTKLHEDTVVSNDHPFLVGKDITRHKRYNYTSEDIENGLEWKESKYLSIGDYVAIPKPVISKSIYNIDISTILNNDCVVETDLLYLKNGYSPKNTKYSYKNLVREFGYTKKIFESAVKHLKLNTKPVSDTYTHSAFEILNNIGYEVKIPNKVNRYININDDVLSLFGWYLAEGSTNNDTFLEIDLHRKEYDVALHLSTVFQNEFGVSNNSILVEKYDNKSRLILSSKIIASLFSTMFGKGANNKHIPGWLFKKGKNLLPMVRCLFSGDGHDSGSTYVLTTTSSSLAYQTKLLLNSFGYCPRVNCKPKSKYGNYAQYIVSVANNDYLSFIHSDIKNDEREFFIETPNFFIVKVTKIEEILYDDYMFDFSVEDGKSFVGNGLLLHNCPFQGGAAGNPIIITGFGGALEYAKEHNSYLVNYFLTPVSGMPWSPWYRGDQLWAEPDVLHGSKLMKEVYDNQEAAKQKGKILQKEIKENFSWEAIGKKIIKELEVM